MTVIALSITAPWYVLGPVLGRTDFSRILGFELFKQYGRVPKWVECKTAQARQLQIPPPRDGPRKYEKSQKNMCTMVRVGFLAERIFRGFLVSQKSFRNPCP